MRKLIRIELTKYSRVFNILFSIFALVYIGFMCYANVNVAILENAISDSYTELDATTEEFIRNCLIILPIWCIASNGIDFKNFSIQKNFADGLTRGEYLACKVFSNSLIIVNAILFYIIIIVVISQDMHFQLRFSRLAISILQITLIAIGYVLVSFTLLLLFRSLSKALLAFFAIVLIELVISFTLASLNSWSGQITGPFSAVRRLAFDSSKRYVVLNDISYVSWIGYICVVLASFLVGMIYFNKKEFKPI